MVSLTRRVSNGGGNTNTTPSGDRCVECLIAMGPMVEADALKIVRDEDDDARSDAAKIISGRIPVPPCA